jgi:hypothetical protein
MYAKFSLNSAQDAGVKPLRHHGPAEAPILTILLDSAEEVSHTEG